MNQQLEESQFELEVYGLAYLAGIECQYFLIILTISDYLSDISHLKETTSTKHYEITVKHLPPLLEKPWENLVQKLLNSQNDMQMVL